MDRNEEPRDPVEIETEDTRGTGQLADLTAAAARRLLTTYPRLAPNELAETTRKSFPVASDDDISRVADDLCQLEAQDLEEVLATVCPDLDWDDLGEAESKHQDATRKVEILDVDAILNQKPTPPLIHGILGRGELGMVFGPPGCGKTFVSIDVSLAIATGSIWGNHRAEPGLVVYIAGEGAAGFPRRLLAASGEPIPEALRRNFRMISAGVNLRDTNHAQPLIEALHGLEESPALIVVDTVHRCAGGVDENSAQEVGLLIEVCDELRRRFGCAVLLIHHSRKDSADVFRGSSAIEGAVDVMFQVRPADVGDRKFLTVISRKQKDREPFEDLHFELETVQLEPDEFGERTSLRLVQTSSPIGRELPPWFVGTESEFEVLESVLMFRDDPLTSAQVADQLPGVGDGSVRKHVVSLVEKGYVKRTDRRPKRLLPGPKLPASMQGGNR